MPSIKRLFQAACLSILITSCTGQPASQSLQDESIEDTVLENIIEDENMRHEIVAIESFSDLDLVTINEKDERYIIKDYSRFKTDFEIGQKIGISYLEKSKNSDGFYELTGENVTREGPFIFTPLAN